MHNYDDKRLAQTLMGWSLAFLREPVSPQLAVQIGCLPGSRKNFMLLAKGNSTNKFLLTMSSYCAPSRN